MSEYEIEVAYGARSEEYLRLFGDIGSAAQADRQAVVEWARGVTGPVIDVGCGPGQWTHLLSTEGHDVEGVDPTPEFVEAAIDRYPRDRFRSGRAQDLGVGSHAVGGILAWYSLIHLGPDQMDEALVEFARSLRPGGGLLIGFF